MDLLELRERIVRWEDLHTEFKQWPFATDAAAAAIVSFANTDGGQLIVGVDPQRNIVGIDVDPDDAYQWIDNISRQNCLPPVTVVQEHIRDDGRTVIVVNVPKGSQRPYRTNKGQFFVRTTSGKRDASQEELRRLFQKSRSLYFDETSMAGSSIADLDLALFGEFVAQLGARAAEQEPERLLHNLHLMEEGEATIAGLVLFGLDPQRRLPEARVVAARIRGTRLSDEVIDQRECRGSIKSIVDCVDVFFRGSLTTAHRPRGFEDERAPELPVEALREFTMNALAHRDYVVGAAVRLFVFDDRVEIRSPGGLPNTVNMEAILLGAAHVLRNPTIYASLVRMGLVTDLGSGVVRSIDRIRAAIGMDPILRIEGDEFVVKIPRPSAGAARPKPAPA
ncbi:MAG: putative DNA binding domain-containing protein [Chloroflexi bacterium]|nr:putative DNA binding domain-containing protein [Chloroflexota bacterium]